jgi:hypothetical protein
VPKRKPRGQWLAVCIGLLGLIESSCSPSTRAKPANAAVTTSVAVAPTARSTPDTSGSLLSSSPSQPRPDNHPWPPEPEEPEDVAFQAEAESSYESDEHFESEKTVSEVPAAEAIDVSQLSKKELRSLKNQMIAASIEEYDGPCPCPYNTMRNGRQCGGRSAYSRPGGESPLCFEGDISIEMVRTFLERRH